MLPCSVHCRLGKLVGLSAFFFLRASRYLHFQSLRLGVGFDIRKIRSTNDLSIWTRAGMMDSRQQQQHQHHHQQPYQQRPLYPQQATSSSATSSAFQSSSSLASLSSINSTAMSQVSHLGVPSSSAPLPSPSAQQPASYFGSQPSHMQQQRMSSRQQQTSHVGQRPAGGPSETAHFLQDFNLIAEAAKRAQMACLSRDLGEVGL